MINNSNCPRLRVTITTNPDAVLTMDTSSTTTSVSVSMTSAESSCELCFYVSAESFGGPSRPSAWRSEFASSSTMFLAESYCDEEKGREARTNTGPSNALGDGRGYARGGRRASQRHTGVASATTLVELESLSVTLSTALTSINANITSTNYITHPPQDRRASTTVCFPPFIANFLCISQSLSNTSFFNSRIFPYSTSTESMKGRR